MPNQLLILPFDHRHSLARDVLGADYKILDNKQKKQITALKEIIYAGFLEVVKKYPDQKNDFGILVDEEFGLSIISKAQKAGITLALSTEKSGQKNYELEYGNQFSQHIKKINPNYVKVLVRYNPQNKKINKKQLKELKRVSQFCVQENYPLLFELLVPPTKKDLKKAGSKEEYDNTLRLKRSIKAIKQIKKKVEVAIWKVEWFSQNGWQKIIKAVNPDSQIIVLGRGDSKKKVKRWLTTAAQFEKVIGFAVGRTVFLRAIEDYQNKKITRAQAIKTVANNFDHLVKLWLKAKS